MPLGVDGELRQHGRVPLGFDGELRQHGRVPLGFDGELRQHGRDASNAASADAFLLHPLAVDLHALPGSLVWTCRERIPDPEAYRLVRHPEHTPTAVRHACKS